MVFYFEYINTLFYVVLKVKIYHTIIRRKKYTHICNEICVRFSFSDLLKLCVLWCINLYVCQCVYISICVLYRRCIYTYISCILYNIYVHKLYSIHLHFHWRIICFHNYLLLYAYCAANRHQINAPKQIPVSCLKLQGMWLY